MNNKILKNILFVSFFLLQFTNYSSSEINSKAWSTKCNEDKKTCIIIIKNEIKTEGDKAQRLATAFIQIGSSKQKKMNLIDEDDQTYKLSEENKNVSVLFVNLPLNTDLKKKPLVAIDGKNLGNLTFSHCNQVDGCTTNVVIGSDAIDLFRKGNTMSVIMGVYGSAKSVKIEFPLKNFSKSYAKLLKK